jgi:hypothetical protein
MKILLVEPDYKNRFPPLGLMKISTYHKDRGDQVRFVKGIQKDLDLDPDRIYIATLFSFYHQITMDTVKYYKDTFKDSDIVIGGIYSTLNPERFVEEVGIKPLTGLLDRAGILGDDDVIVDRCIPDYSILSEINYEYAHGSSFVGYATRGCVNKCGFCAVSKLEPVYTDDTDFDSYLSKSMEKFGERQNLILFDNNILASKQLEKIVESIKSFGFHAGAKFKGKARSVDFNQGVDSRLFEGRKIEILSRIYVNPLRIAFDHIGLKDVYVRAVEIAIEHGLTRLSNLMLYNFNDSPDDLYNRLKVVMDLNARLKARISSFPMKYIPLNSVNRSFIGKEWTRKQIMGVHCILTATKGAAPRNQESFDFLFGSDLDQFKKIILLPDHYITSRMKNKSNIEAWMKKINALSESEMKILENAISENSKRSIYAEYKKNHSMKIKSILDHYVVSEQKKFKLQQIGLFDNQL